MSTDALMWIFLPVLVAAGSALLSYFITQARMEVALARERETLAEARAAIGTHKMVLEQAIKSTEEATRRKALDDFMQDIRVEERSYMRETKSLLAMRKTMVMQERLYFRNIPLSNWVEHEMVIEEGGDVQRLAKSASVFSTTRSLSEESKSFSSKLLEQSAGRYDQAAS